MYRQTRQVAGPRQATDGVPYLEAWNLRQGRQVA